MTADDPAAEFFAELDSPLSLLSPKWLYDDTGSGLFEAITGLPEYYPTRVELSLLDAHASTVATLTNATQLTELGSGASPKTQSLIRGFLDASPHATFTAFDINADAAHRSVEDLTRLFPQGNFTAQHGDFNHGVPQSSDDGTHVIAFLGSTIGNFTSPQRRAFLESMHASMGVGDWFLLGVDLVKNTDRLLAAYNDSAGITKRFILNVLSNINHVCGTNFDMRNFEYVPSWNVEEERIEMRLVCTQPQLVSAHTHHKQFNACDSILVEISTKFRLSIIAQELQSVGITPTHQFVASDTGQDEPDFALILAQRQA